MTTITNFVTALGDIAITGVSNKLNEPPRKLTTADLPAQWVQVPSLERAPATFQSQGKLWDTHRAQLVVAFEPVGQSTQAANWSGVLTLMDNVWSAIALASIVQGRLQYTIAQGIVTVADLTYWAVVAEVEAHG
jgi:hypothetical protein